MLGDSDPFYNKATNTHDFVTIDVICSTPACKQMVTMRSYSVGHVPIPTDERFYIDINGEQFYWMCRW